MQLHGIFVYIYFEFIYSVAIFFREIPGHAEVIRILVNYTENPNAPDREGRTPMEIATQNKDFEIMKILEPFA